MILGDSLQVMASLAEREGLRGKVQCIYIDPPYGIKFNSNFQWSTTSRDVKDGNADHITREPEQVKAFRDTWRDGIHCYLTYLRDRLTVARDLLTESGSIFVQIGDENVHRVRALMDEVFGEENFVAHDSLQEDSRSDQQYLLASCLTIILWYAKDMNSDEVSTALCRRERLDEDASQYNWFEASDGDSAPIDCRREDGDAHAAPAGSSLQLRQLVSQSGADITSSHAVRLSRAQTFVPTARRHWKTTRRGHAASDASAIDLMLEGNTPAITYVSSTTFQSSRSRNIWDDTSERLR